MFAFTWVRSRPIIKIGSTWAVKFGSLLYARTAVGPPSWERFDRLRVPLESYLGREMPGVYSLVAAIPFSPVDVDLNVLARGEWDALTDRFRVWFLPKTEGQTDKASCYVMIRKFDQQQAVLVCVHIVANLEVGEGGDGQRYFTLGILSNDDIRARAILGIFIGVPPIFHRRSEITLTERKWRTDSATVARFAANVHSTVTAKAGHGGEVYRLSLQPASDLLANLKPLDAWWDTLAPDSSDRRVEVEGDEDIESNHKA
jgi:hypothetical protein